MTAKTAAALALLSRKAEILSETAPEDSAHEIEIRDEIAAIGHLRRGGGSGRGTPVDAGEDLVDHS